jgi:hypothetical protein
MNCWNCETQLIWGGDHDLEEDVTAYNIVTNLSCPKCHTYVEVYHPDQDHSDWEEHNV